MKNVELQKLVGGALQEKFAKSFEKVIENLQDPNTSFKIKRGLMKMEEYQTGIQRKNILLWISL